MVAFYINQIEKDLMTLEEVPKLWRAKVEKELEKEQTKADAEVLV